MVIDRSFVTNRVWFLVVGRALRSHRYPCNVPGRVSVSSSTAAMIPLRQLMPVLYLGSM
jgi:hypothetical protein